MKEDCSSYFSQNLTLRSVDSRMYVLHMSKYFSLRPFSNLRIRVHCQSWWPRGLRHGFAGSFLLGLRVRILPRALMSLVSVCVVR
jgi:hypothetical protein